MKPRFRPRRAAVALGLAVSLAAGTGAAGESDPSTLAFPPPLDLRFQVLDLDFRSEKVAGATEGLAIEETETEIRIELSGDVLFDFDKADIRAEAEKTLGQVAEVIGRHPKA
ncbi:MAG: hypothetical protein ACREQ9_03880, partial [Candidatus Binatia bacterium]